MKQKGMIVKIVLCVLLLSMLCGFKLFPRDINIIYTSDVHSKMDNSMNYASVKRFKDILKKNSKYVTLIDGGDYTLEGNLGDNSKGEAIIEIMNDVGYDIATLGNHDFDKGIDVIKKNIDDANFDIIGCNIKYTGDKEDPFTNVKPYVVKKYGSTKVAYVGILTPDTLMNDKESYFNCMENGKLNVDFYANPNDPEETGDSIYSVIQNTVDEARTKANYVVAVAHIGINSNPVINSRDLAQYTHGIDVILDAHSHKEVDERITNNEGKEVVLFAVGKEMEKIGHVVIKTNGTIKTEMVTDIERDPTVDSKIQTLIEKYAQIREEEEARQREIEEELQREQEKANLIKEKWNSLLKPKSYKESLEERIKKNSEN